MLTKRPSFSRVYVFVVPSVPRLSVDCLVPADSAEIRYYEIEENDRWRLGIVSELTDAKFGLATVDGFSRAELKTILVHVCTS